jgi:hypothetical protein
MLRLHWTTSLRLPNGYFVLFERSQQGRGALEILMLKSLFHPRQAIHLCGIIKQGGFAWLGMLGVGVSRRQVGRPMKEPCFWQGSVFAFISGIWNLVYSGEYILLSFWQAPSHSNNAISLPVLVVSQNALPPRL